MTVIAFASSLAMDMTGATAIHLLSKPRPYRIKQFVIDGEAVLLGVDGVSDFDGLHSRKHNDEVQLYAFDILALDGDDLRKLPLHLRKNNLAQLLAREPDGIHLAPFEQGEIGPDLFRAACNMMLEGLVSKRGDSRYRAGTSRDWINGLWRQVRLSGSTAPRASASFSRTTAATTFLFTSACRARGAFQSG